METRVRFEFLFDREHDRHRLQSDLNWTFETLTRLSMLIALRFQIFNGVGPPALVAKGSGSCMHLLQVSGPDPSF